MLLHAFFMKRLASTPDTPLVVNDSHLSRVENFKYLGSNFLADLAWGKRITSISHKTRKLIGMFYWNFYKFFDQDTSLKLCKLLILPHLEYASAVRSPYVAKHIKTIEDVQKFALKVCTKIGIPIMSCFCYNLTWTPWLSVALSWMRSWLLFKIIHGDVFY